jgi:hypothetical protein
MTAQISEILWVAGEQVALLTEPLADYFEQGGHNPGFEATSTALWRGYVGEWAMLDDRLYLVGLSGALASGEDATLASLFPDHPDRVFAHWYSGTLRVPKGKLLQYVHMGYASTYEQDMFLRFRKGVLVGQHTQTHGQAAPDAPKGYGIQAMTTWPRKGQGGKS